MSRIFWIAVAVFVNIAIAVVFNIPYVSLFNAFSAGFCFAILLVIIDQRKRP